MEKDSVKVHLLPMISKMSQPRLMTTEERKEWFEDFINYGDYTETIKNQIRNGYVEVNY